MAERPPAVVLHRDDHLVVVDKPAGIVVHRGWAREPDVLMMRVRDTVGCRVFPVHRLDRGTSGAVLFALSSEVAQRLSAALAAQRVHKTYLALVRGAPPDEGAIDHPLPPGEDHHAARVPAETLFRTLERYGRYSLVEARPLTGRLHQIRRHMKHMSWPLIGDVRYGKGEHNRLFRERFGLHRLFLHAQRLAFEHPVTAAPMVVQAPLPEALARVLDGLRRG